MRTYVQTRESLFLSLSSSSSLPRLLQVWQPWTQNTNIYSSTHHNISSAITFSKWNYSIIRDLYSSFLHFCFHLLSMFWNILMKMSTGTGFTAFLLFVLRNYLHRQMSTSTTQKRKRGAGPRLNDVQRLQIIELVTQPSSPSLRSIARRFSVDEKAIRNLIKNKDEVLHRAEQSDISRREKTFRGRKAKSTIFIDAGRNADDSKDLCHDALEVTDEVIAKDPDTKDLYASNGNVNSDRNDEELQNLQQIVEEKQILRELLDQIVEIELKLGLITTTTYLTSDKLNQAKSAVATARLILQEANSKITSEEKANCRQRTLHDFYQN